MGKIVVWSADALLQLEDIHFYILFESKSITVADKVIDKIFNGTEILEISSEIYKLDDLKIDNNGSFRVYFVFDYMISYQICTDTISILRVRHTSRNPKAL